EKPPLTAEILFARYGFEMIALQFMFSNLLNPGALKDLDLFLGTAAKIGVDMENLFRFEGWIHTCTPYHIIADKESNYPLYRHEKWVELAVHVLAKYFNKPEHMYAKNSNGHTALEVGISSLNLAFLETFLGLIRQP